MLLGYGGSSPCIVLTQHPNALAAIRGVGKYASLKSKLARERNSEKPEGESWLARLQRSPLVQLAILFKELAKNAFESRRGVS